MICTDCGHEWGFHGRRVYHGVVGQCSAWVRTGEGINDGYSCPCAGYNDARLPITGERLEFGVHRLPSWESETAPAWPSLAIYQGRRDAAFTRAQKKVQP